MVWVGKGVRGGNNVRTCCVHVMQNTSKYGVYRNHPHVLHSFTSRIPNTTDGPQHKRWNGWSTVASWMTPQFSNFLLRAMSLQIDAWFVPSKVRLFCSSKLQQNKNPAKHRRFDHAPKTLARAASFYQVLQLRFHLATYIYNYTYIYMYIYIYIYVYVIQRFLAHSDYNWQWCMNINCGVWTIENGPMGYELYSFYVT